MDIERPSGKGTAEENFPVGSVLIAPRLRPHVAAFYAFARAADDIADDPALPPDDKIARFDRLAAAILGRETDDAALEKAHRLRRSLADTGLGPTHCTDLLAAFKQDATKNRYADWGELMDYCELSACPVGRFVLDLHREARASYAASDALCSALQVLCGTPEPRRRLDRHRPSRNHRKRGALGPNRGPFGGRFRRAKGPGQARDYGAPTGFVNRVGP